MAIQFAFFAVMQRHTLPARLEKATKTTKYAAHVFLTNESLLLQMLTGLCQTPALASANCPKTTISTILFKTVWCLWYNVALYVSIATFQSIIGQTNRFIGEQRRNMRNTTLSVRLRSRSYSSGTHNFPARISPSVFSATTKITRVDITSNAVPQY